MTEGKATRMLCRELEHLGCLTFAIVGSVRQESGWPDRYIVGFNWTGWVEFKGPTTTWTDKQQWVHRELRRRKVHCVMARFNHEYTRLVFDNGTACDANGEAFLEALYAV